LLNTAIFILLLFIAIFGDILTLPRAFFEISLGSTKLAEQTLLLVVGLWHRFCARSVFRFARTGESNHSVTGMAGQAEATAEEMAAVCGLAESTEPSLLDFAMRRKVHRLRAQFRSANALPIFANLDIKTGLVNSDFCTL